MRLEEIKPFVRQALIASINSNTKDDVFYELQSSDCRLFYVISGSGDMTIHGVTYSLSPGCAILFQSGTRYIWQTSQETAIDYIAINFDYTLRFSAIKKPFHPVHVERFSSEDVLENILFEDATVLNRPIVLYNAGAIESRLRLLTTEYNMADRYYSDELMSTVLKSVIISMVREARLSKEDRRRRDASLTRDIIQYIQSNYDKEISYEMLADSFHMNPVYINRVFKKNTGVSLHVFLVNYRITTAMEILRSGSMSVKEIASMVGFSDLPHFTKTFKRITGITPGRYRDSTDQLTGN
jgi:AraC-like DNA-binding protein